MVCAGVRCKTTVMKHVGLNDGIFFSFKKKQAGREEWRRRWSGSERTKSSTNKFKTFQRETRKQKM